MLICIRINLEFVENWSVIVKIKNLAALSWVYYVFGCLGGSILGFISLGIPGLLIGLFGGLIMSAILRKGILWAKNESN